MRWFKFYPDDYLRGVRGLTAEEAGVYMAVLALMYQEGGAIPDDERWICGAARISTRAWHRVRDKLCRMGKIIPNTDGFLINHRVLSEIEIAQNFSETHRKLSEKGGKNSAKARAALKENNALAPPPVEPPVKQIELDIENISPNGDIPLFEEKGPDLKLVHSGPKPADIDAAVASWNEAAGRRGWARIAKLTPKRRQAVAGRIREHGIETWREVLAFSETQAWLNDPSKRGAGHEGWRPSIDWFSSASKFLRQLEAMQAAPAANGQPSDEERADILDKMFRRGKYADA